MKSITQKTFRQHFKITLLVVGIIFTIGGVLLSPDFLMYFGFFKGSLTFENNLVVTTTLLEISIIKWTLLFVGLISLIIYFTSNKISSTSFFKELFLQSKLNLFDQNTYFFNRSFYVIYSLIFASILYLLFGNNLFSDEILKSINIEDGWIENISAIVFLITALVSFSIVFKIKERKLDKFIYLGFGFLFIFIAGEEISWGQRLFQFETIAPIKEINVQGENNIHNMFGYFFDHMFIAGIFIWGFISPILYRKNLFFKGLFNYCKIPIASLGLASGFLIISMYHDSILYRMIDELKYLRIAEMREFLTSLALLILFLEARARFKSTTQVEQPVEIRAELDKLAVNN